MSACLQFSTSENIPTEFSSCCFDPAKEEFFQLGVGAAYSAEEVIVVIVQTAAPIANALGDHGLFQPSYRSP